MLDTKFKFINTDNEFILLDQLADKEKPFYPLQKLSNFSNLNLSSLIYNIKSINELQNNIINSISIHQSILSHLNLPTQIDINFTETNKIKNIFDNLFTKNKSKSIGNTSTDLNENNKLTYPIVNISIDLLNPKNDKNDNLLDFSRNLKLAFNENVHLNKIITDLVFFHELGHIVLNQNYLNTILVSPLKNKDENIVPALTQITNNIMEGFCDLFSTYLTNKQYSNYKIIENYELIRVSSFQSYDEQHSIIEPYNTSSVINKLKNTKINEATIISDLLNLSIENSLTLTKEQLTNSKFKSELIENLKLILNNQNLKLESNNEFTSILNQELLSYNPIKTSKIKP